MGFKVSIVEDCPHTRKANGLVLMPPSLISQLAAAVHEKEEWAILLTGKREDNGYLITVDGYTIPPQERSGAHVSIAPLDLEENVVGVIHSHHQMGAFFSSTDTGELNPRFPMSIVIAHGKTTYLGFAYKGTGKVTLPCGSTGEINFFIQPTVGPVVNSVSKVTEKESDFGKCNRYVITNDPDEFHVKYASNCGLEHGPYLKAAAFPLDNALLDQVVLLPRPAPVVTTVNRSMNTVDTHTGRKYIGVRTQKQVSTDIDSRHCKIHKEWDYCQYNERFNSKIVTTNGAYVSQVCSVCHKWPEYCTCGRNQRCPKCYYTKANCVCTASTSFGICAACESTNTSRGLKVNGVPKVYCNNCKGYQFEKVILCPKTKLNLTTCKCGDHETVVEEPTVESDSCPVCNAVDVVWASDEHGTNYLYCNICLKYVHVEKKEEAPSGWVGKDGDCPHQTVDQAGICDDCGAISYGEAYKLNDDEVIDDDRKFCIQCNADRDCPDYECPTCGAYYCAECDKLHEGLCEKVTEKYIGLLGL